MTKERPDRWWLDQNEYLKWLGVDWVQPFRFESRTHRRGLQEKLGGEELIPELEFCCLGYRLNTCHNPDDQPESLPSKKQLERELSALAGAAENLHDRIYRSSVYLKHGLIWPEIEAWGIDPERLLTALVSVQNEANWRLEHHSDPLLMKRRGRPRDEAVHELNVAVAKVLDRNGVPVSRSRDGTFARVLGIIRDAVDQPLAVECFKEIEQAVDHLEWSKRGNPLTAWLEKQNCPESS